MLKSLNNNVQSFFNSETASIQTKIDMLKNQKCMNESILYLKM